MVCGLFAVWLFIFARIFRYLSGFNHFRIYTPTLYYVRLAYPYRLYGILAGTCSVFFFDMPVPHRAGLATPVHFPVRR